MSVGRSSFILGFLFFVVIGFAPAAQAQNAPPNPAEASAFVNRVGDKAISTMADKSLSKPQMIVAFRKLLNETFDLPTIGRYVLGRYWNQATPQQQQDYLVQFEEMVVLSYADRFTSYNGGKFRITSTRPDGDRDVFVTTEIYSVDAPSVNVDWRVRTRAARIAIIDVVVEGVSMSLTQRQEFASVIQSKGGNLQALIDALRDKNASLAALYR